MFSYALVTMQHCFTQRLLLQIKKFKNQNDIKQIGMFITVQIKKATNNEQKSFFGEPVSNKYAEGKSRMTP